MTEAVEQITIKSRGDLIVSKKSQKTYFTVDTDDRRLLCFIPSLYNELPDGATVLVNIRPGRSETDTPSITGMSTENEMKSATEIPRQIEKPEGTKEQSIETQVAIKEIGELIRSGKLPVDDALAIAYIAWITSRVLGDIVAIEKAYKEAKDELNRPDDNRWTSPTRQPSEQSAIPSEETRGAQLKRIGQLAIKAGYTKKTQKLWDAWLEVNYKKTDITQLTQEDLNKLEEQLKGEAK